MVLSPSLSSPESWREAYQSQFLDLIEQGKAMPREIASTDVEMRDLLAPICTTLGIKLKAARRTPMLDEALDGFLSYFEQM
jgi:hypothetical protein